jgi:molecular chaperone DnaK
VGVRVLQSVAPSGRPCRLLAQLDLDGLAPEPAGAPRVEVCLEMDHNGIVWVTARDRRSGREKRMRLAGGRRLGPAEADELRGKAELFRNGGGRQGGGMRAGRERAQACLDLLEAQLRARPADLDAPGAAGMQALAEAVRRLMEGDDPAALAGAVAELESAREALSDWAERRRRSRAGGRPDLDMEL